MASIGKTDRCGVAVNATALLASLPSPSFKSLHIGPVQLRIYGLMIAMGVVAAVWLAERRWLARGGKPEEIQSLAAWAVPVGLVGARLYHVVTSFDGYRSQPWRMFEIWEGGLGIPGGIAAGVLGGLVVARRRNLPLSPLLDAIAPALPLAQAIGRWGNWFNQELFGRPTSLPWGLRIDLANRPVENAASTTFQPTFLYESLWNLTLAGCLIFFGPRLRLRPGRLFALYLAGYASGRLWIERMRIDAAHSVGGLRLNEWTAIIVLGSCVVFFVRDALRSAPRRELAAPADADLVGG